MIFLGVLIGGPPSLGIIWSVSKVLISNKEREGRWPPPRIALKGVLEHVAYGAGVLFGWGVILACVGVIGYLLFAA